MIRTHISELCKNPKIVLASFGIGGLIIGIGIGYARMRNSTRGQNGEKGATGPAGPAEPMGEQASS